MGSCQGLLHPPGPHLQQWTTASGWGVVQEEKREISSGPPPVHKVILYSSVLGSDCLLQRKPKGGQWSQDEQEDRQGAWSSSRRKEMVPREGQSSPCHCSLLYRRLVVPLQNPQYVRAQTEGTWVRICWCWSSLL